MPTNEGWARDWPSGEFVAFHSVQAKPRLRRVAGGLWECWGGMWTVTGYGLTPADAYRSWRQSIHPEYRRVLEAPQ